MSRIETGVVTYTLSVDFRARCGSAIDAEAVDDAVLAELNRLLPPGVLVERGGRVLVEEERADAARAIDWAALLGAIDRDRILADHAR